MEDHSAANHHASLAQCELPASGTTTSAIQAHCASDAAYTASEHISVDHRQNLAAKQVSALLGLVSQLASSAFVSPEKKCESGEKCQFEGSGVVPATPKGSAALNSSISAGLKSSMESHITRNSCPTPLEVPVESTESSATASPDLSGAAPSAAEQIHAKGAASPILSPANCREWPKKKLCEFPGCIVQPSFNFPGEKGGSHCAAHRLEGQINTVNKMCEVPGCFVRPSFKFPVRGAASQRCARHKLPGMIGNSCKSPASTPNVEPKSADDEIKVATPKRVRGEMLRIQREEMMRMLTEHDDSKGSAASEAKTDVPPSMLDSLTSTSSKRMKQNLAGQNTDHGGSSSLSLSSSSNSSSSSNAALASQPIDSGLQQILSCVTQQTKSISKAARPAAPEHMPQQLSLQAAINAANFSIPSAAQNTGVDFNQALLAYNAYNAALWNAGSVVSMTNPYAMSNVNCSSPFAALSAMPPSSCAYNPSLLLNPSLASSLHDVYSQFPLNWTLARPNYGAGPSPQMAWNGYNSVSLPTYNTFQTFGRS